ncbi:MAG: imelysin family protein [Pseudomonadota bacterium]
MKHLLAAALTFFPALAEAQSRFDAESAAILQDGLIVTADEFILPGYVALSDGAARMEMATEAYCSGAGSIEAAQEGFAETFLAWQRISVIQIGPISAGKGPMRVQVWPDPKGFSRRAVRAAVLSEDPALLAEGALEGHSVALVNLTALETLLFNALERESYACDLATAIARYQSGLARDIAADWEASAFRTAFDTAATGNDTYRDVDTLMRAFLAGTVVYTDRLRKFKLQRGLGSSAGEARPERSEARKSGLGLRSIEVSFAALRDLYELPYGFFDVTPDAGGSMDFFVLGETAGSISATLSFEDRTLDDILTEDGQLAEELRRFAELTLFHEDYLKVGLPASIGLTAGFTSADGD